MARRAETSQKLARVASLERDQNVAGLIAELNSEIELGRYMIVRGHAALALGRLGDLRAVPHLVELTTDKDEVVRMDALLALGMLRSEEAYAAALAGLDDASPAVRMAAAEALGRLGSPGAIVRLRQAVDGDQDAEVRLHAAEALVELGDQEVADRIPEVLRAVSWRVRRHPRWRKLGQIAAH